MAPLNFASYFRYCHHGIEEFLRQRGLPHELFRNRKEGFGLPIVGAARDFYRPVKYDGELRLLVSFDKIKEKALTLGVRFFWKDQAELVAKGQATLAAIDRTWQSIRLPERLRAALD